MSWINQIVLNKYYLPSSRLIFWGSTLCMFGGSNEYRPLIWNMLFREDELLPNVTKSNISFARIKTYIRKYVNKNQNWITISYLSEGKSWSFWLSLKGWVYGIPWRDVVELIRGNFDCWKFKVSVIV